MKQLICVYKEICEFRNNEKLDINKVFATESFIHVQILLREYFILKHRRVENMKILIQFHKYYVKSNLKLINPLLDKSKLKAQKII